MPELDFRKTLSSAPDPVSPGSCDATEQESCVGTISPREKSSDTERSGIGLFEVANLLFALLALAGGLFCAFFFYNGADLMRRMRAWPAELADARPLPSTEIAQIVLPHGSAAKTATLEKRASGVERDADGEPFGPGVGSLDRPRFSVPRGLNDGGNGNSGFHPSLPSSGSRTGQSTGLSRGADALSQIFDRAVSDLERTRIADTKRIVVVIKTTPSATRTRVSASLKTARLQNSNARVPIAHVVKGAERQARSTGVAAINTLHSNMNSKIGNPSRPGIGVGNGLDQSGVSRLGGAGGSRGIGSRLGGLSRGLGGGGRH